MGNVLQKDDAAVAPVQGPAPAPDVEPTLGAKKRSTKQSTKRRKKARNLLNPFKGEAENPGLEPTEDAETTLPMAVTEVEVAAEVAPHLLVSGYSDEENEDPLAEMRRMEAAADAEADVEEPEEA